MPYDLWAGYVDVSLSDHSLNIAVDDVPAGKFCCDPENNNLSLGYMMSLGSGRQGIEARIGPAFPAFLSRHLQHEFHHSRFASADGPLLADSPTRVYASKLFLRR